jgi:hypothetical protein
MEEYDFRKLSEKDKRRAREEASYSAEYDLYNSTMLEELNKEERDRRIMGGLDAKNRLS